MSKGETDNPKTRSRDEVMRLLKSRGSMIVEDISEALEITISGTRQHLAKLEADNLVTYDLVRQGPGRPRHLYRLTEKGHERSAHNLLPFVLSALSIVGERDRETLEYIFHVYCGSRTKELRSSMTGDNDRERLESLVELLNAENCFASIKETDKRLRLTVRNCPMAGIGARFPVACEAELSILARCLPEYVIKQESSSECRIGGACIYRLEPRPE